MGRQLNYALKADLGYDSETMVMLPLPTETEFIRLEGMKERLLARTAIKNASACFSSPGAADNSWYTNLRYENRQENEPFGINAKLADKDYLETFGLKHYPGRFPPRSSGQ